MKKFFFFTLAIALYFSAFAGSLFANSSKSEAPDAVKLFSITIGQGAGKIAYTPDLPDLEPLGPESFAVAPNGNVLILDTIDNQVEKFNKEGQYLGTVELQPNNEFNDIELGSNNTFYVVNDVGQVLEYKNDQLEKQYKFNADPSKNKVLGLYLTKGNDVTLRFQNGEEVNLNKHKRFKTFDGFSGKKVGKNTVLSSSEQQITINYDYTAAGTYPLQYTNSGAQLVLVNEALIGNDMYVETRIGKFKNNQRIGSALAISTKGTYYVKVPEHFIKSTKNGDLYQLVTNKDSVDIYQLNFSKDKRTKINAELVSKIKPDSDTIQGEVSTSTVTRSTAFSRAYDYTEYQWVFDETTMLTPYVSGVSSTPDHLNSSSVPMQTGIPYRWGGFNGTDTADYSSSPNFITELWDGETAGNVTFTSAAVSSDTSGLDCSGFISAAYEFDHKLGTVTIPNYFMNWTWGSIQLGDIANKYNDHVWMYNGQIRDSYGNLIAYSSIEETVSGTGDKTKLYSHTLSDAQNYNPMTIQ